MKTTKSFTSVEQSRKLAEILPLESADMHYIATYASPSEGIVEYRDIPELGYSKQYTPCWSLAALLDVLPDSIYDNTNKYSQLEFSKKSVAYHGMNDRIKIGTIKGNLVDACYEMILKLHEEKIL